MGSARPDPESNEQWLTSRSAPTSEQSNISERVDGDRTDTNGIRFSEPTLVVERHRVMAELPGQKGLRKRLALAFTDGSQVQVDVAAMQPLKKFVSMLSSADL
jgi:hypothetical protein